MTKSMLLVSCLLSLLCIIALLPSTTACQPPNCDRPDQGSCGNACCLIYAYFDTDPDIIQKHIEGSMVQHGGPDGRYTLQATAESKTPGFVSLMKMSGGRIYSMGQAWHTTKVHRYNDTMNFVLYPVAPTVKHRHSGTMLKAFSISQIGGAYGDGSQNWKNIIGLLLGSKIPGRFNVSTVLGCPPRRRRHVLTQEVVAEDTNDDLQLDTSDMGADDDVMTLLQGHASELRAARRGGRDYETF